MKTLLRSILLMLAASTSQLARADGLDLTEAALGCIMSGGNCLAHTGISFIDALFGRGSTQYHTDESFCYAYTGNWCLGPAGYPSAKDECRESKKKFYKAAKQKIGQWKPPTGQKPNDYRQWTEEDYFERLEAQLTKRDDDAHYFTCRPRQQYLWLKNRCEHTNAYSNARLERRDRPDIWAMYKTNNCHRGH